MTNQLDKLKKLNLTQVTVTLGDDRVMRFVTDMPYRRVVLRVLSITRLWTTGLFTEDQAAFRIVNYLRHVPVFGTETDIRDYVDSRDGHHVHADYSANTVYVGRNKHRDTWGQVTIGNHVDDMVWNNGAEINGPSELNGE